MQNTIAVGVSLPQEILSKIDQERNDVSRSRFVLRLVEYALERRKKTVTVQEEVLQ